jgi:hypothetical protein
MTARAAVAHERRRNPRGLKALTNIENIARARAMRADGMDDHQIAAELGLEVAYVRRVIASIRNIDGEA